MGRSANPAFTWTLSPFVALLRNWPVSMKLLVRVAHFLIMAGLD